MLSYLGLVGANESGKSTLCLVASGLAPASIGGSLTGTLTIDGAPAAGLRTHELAERVVVGFQNPNTQRSGIAATVFGVAAMAIHFATVALGGDETVGSAVRLIGGFVWVLVVGLGYPEYRFLRHATGTKRP